MEEFFPPDSIDAAEDYRSAIQNLNTTPSPTVVPANGNGSN